MPAGNSMLRKFLGGEKVGERRKWSSGGMDQVWPVQADNIGKRLFKQKLPREKLLGPEGLSNTSLWIMTGQEFLRRTDPEDDESPDTYYTTTLSHALQAFGSALLHNQDILSRCTSIETNLVNPDSESPPLCSGSRGWCKYLAALSTERPVIFSNCSPLNQQRIASCIQSSMPLPSRIHPSFHFIRRYPLVSH